MALRVLLADESSTIKKVIQLALQDYAVEVHAVNIGSDVLPVAKKFGPDLVFADVLLQKCNGYEVCANIKSDPELKNVPVVLVWSGFLELDEDKLQASRADAQLEKPFDVPSLRKLVNQLVPKTKTQDLSQFLTLPPTPEMPAPPPREAPLGDLTAPTVGIAATENPSSTWNMDSFEPIDKFTDENFQEVSLPKPPPVPGPEEPSAEQILEDQPEDDSQWIQKSLDRFQIDEENLEEIPVSYEVPEEPIKEDFLLHQEEPVNTTGERLIEVSQEVGDLELEELASAGQDLPSHPAIPKTSPSPESMQLSPEELERIIRAQSQEVIEAVVWKVVPELAEQLIKREIHRLLEEKEKPY